MKKIFLLFILFALSLSSFSTYAADDGLGDIFDLLGWLNDTQTNDTQTNDTQTNDTQTNDTQTNDTQTNDTQTNDTQTNDTQTNDTQTNDWVSWLLDFLGQSNNSDRPTISKDWTIKNGNIEVWNWEARIGNERWVNENETVNGNKRTQWMDVINSDLNFNNLNNDWWSHAAASEIDNVVYNPFGYVKWDYVYVYYTPWKGVKNVRIFYSYDWVNFTPLITLSTDHKYYHFPVDFNKKQVYVKILPMDDAGNYGVMKEWIKEIPYIQIPLVGKKVADKKVWHAKTGPELWLLFTMALLVAFLYKRKFN